MDKNQIEAKLKRSLQVLMYIFEMKSGTKGGVSVKNLNFTYWGEQETTTNGSVYFELDMTTTCDDPDPTSLSITLTQNSKMVYNFFKNYMLDSTKLTFVDVDGDDTDDMIGLLMNLTFDWNAGSDNNTNIRYGFEYNFYDTPVTK